jgi:predicted nucleotidyltransferase
MNTTVFDRHVNENSVSLAELLGAVETALLEQTRLHYGERLISVAIFGSAGRGTARPDSDIDLLLVAHGLPDGRVARNQDFMAVEDAMEPALETARAHGCSWYLSVVFKTPEELAFGSPLLLDMTEDARVLYDPEGVLAAALERLRRRLAELGARRVWYGSAWYWDLKPDYVPGEVFEI